MNRKTHRSCYAALAFLVLVPWAARAQPVVGGKGFKFPEYYDAPHETQMKWLLECAQAKLQPDGRWRVTNAKWRTFRVNGDGELVAEAPECFYDKDQRSINSAGPLHVETADGKFSIDGVGFLYRLNLHPPGLQSRP